MSLLDDAIKVGKELEGSEQRKTALKQDITNLESVLAARQQELAKLEREATQRVQAEQTTWEHTRRLQAEALSVREADVTTREAAMQHFPAESAALAQREQAVTKQKADVEAALQRARQLELDWIARNGELDAKAAALNQMASTLKQDITNLESVLAARQQELAKLEREATQRVQAEQTTWEHTRRLQAEALSVREADVTTREAAMQHFPAESAALAQREQAVTKQKADVEAALQRARQLELDWIARNGELDAKAAALNQMASTSTMSSQETPPAPPETISSTETSPLRTELVEHRPPELSQ